MKPLDKVTPLGRPVADSVPFCPSTMMLRLAPGHTDGLAEILTVGCSFTVTVTVAVLEQPVAVSVTVSV